MNYSGFAAEPTGIDWPELLGFAERMGCPVSRVDQHGTTRILRTVAQLEAEWDAA